jgi:hypothetical protein
MLKYLEASIVGGMDSIQRSYLNDATTYIRNWLDVIYAYILRQGDILCIMKAGDIICIMKAG